MKIDAFKTLVQQGGSGRVTATNFGQSFQSIEKRLGGKTQVIKDFFIRAHKETRDAQKEENKTTRQKLTVALKQAYGPRIPEKEYNKILNNLNKPITVSNIKKLIQLGEKNKPMTVSLPKTGGQITLLPKTFPPGMLTKVPDLQTKIQDKINNGFQILNDVMGNPATRGPDNPPSHKEVTDIVWYLHVMAEAKVGTSFKDGALTIKDEGQKLRKFLDKCPDVYERISSHIRGFTESPNGGHRGIDTPKGNTVDDILPHGHMTLLYGTMTANDNTPLHSDMMYFKIESHGCFLAPPKDADRDPNVKSREQRPHDKAHFRGHALSFFTTVIPRLLKLDTQGTFKERIPSDIQKSYKTLIENAKKNGPNGMQEILEKNNPLGTAGGVRVMLQNINEAKNTFGYTARFTGFEGLIQQKFGNSTDNIQYRIGNEIILKEDDILN